MAAKRLAAFGAFAAFGVLAESRAAPGALDRFDRGIDAAEFHPVRVSAGFAIQSDG
jgi:hypothetical protein